MRRGNKQSVLTNQPLSQAFHLRGKTSVASTERHQSAHAPRMTHCQILGDPFVRDRRVSPQQCRQFHLSRITLLQPLQPFPVPRQSQFADALGQQSTGFLLPSVPRRTLSPGRTSAPCPRHRLLHQPQQAVLETLLPRYHPRFNALVASALIAPPSLAARASSHAT